MSAHGAKSEFICGSPIAHRPILRRLPTKGAPPICIIATPPQGNEGRSADTPRSRAPSVLQTPYQSSGSAWLRESTRSLATSIWGVLRFDKYLWNGEAAVQKQANLLGETTERAVEVQVVDLSFFLPVLSEVRAVTHCSEVSLVEVISEGMLTWLTSPYLS